MRRHLEALLTALAIVFVSALIWLGIMTFIGMVMPWQANVILLALAIFAIYRLLLI